MSKMVQDYMLMDVIGSGQYGKVWKAQNVKTSEPYAIKAISIQEISKLAKLKEFVMSEINALELMANRNIVKYYGKLQTQNNIYLIFEFCRGGTLEEAIKREGMMPEYKALAYFDQILNAFSELHRLNIMHRDLKPSNVLMEGGEAKLADFGFCKKLNGEFEMTKSIVGSPIYMAPELLQGKYYCRKADIWSLGVMLYEMLHGKCPYEENSIPTLLEKIKSTEVRIMPGLSAETRQLLQGMLTFNPASRTSWTDLFKRLERHSPGHGSSSNTGMAFTNLTVSSLGDQSMLNVTQDLGYMNETLASRHPMTIHTIPTSDIIRQRSQSRNPHEAESYSPRKVAAYQTAAIGMGVNYSLNDAAKVSSPRSTPNALHLTARPTSDNTTEFRQPVKPVLDADDKILEDVYAAYPLIKEINSRMERSNLSPLPLSDMRRVILHNRKNQHDEFHEILKNRYCVKFIMDKIKLFYLLDFDNSVWQSHMVLLLFKKARKYMLTAKIKASYADLQAMKDRILEPQQLVDYIEAETSDFEQLYAQFLKEVAQIAKEDQADRSLADNVEKPFELDDDHFRSIIVKTVKHISQIEDDNGVSVANGLLDVYSIEGYLSPMVDFREKEKHFENFSNRLTNRELRELVAIKLSLIK